jgi:hypothetical protein
MPVGDTPPPIRTRLEQLRAEEIVELNRGAYPATPIALYRATRSPFPPPIPALTNE